MTTRTEERLFTPFMDPVDGVVCVSADVTAGDLATQLQDVGFRFPLWLDLEAPLWDQLLAADFAPASSRFGPYCDNICGMNWELPDGRLLRIGERVVKSTTGFDLLRFLLAAGDRYGRARDLVLRLRPSCTGGGSFLLKGEVAALEGALASLLQSSFLHWMETVDWIADQEGNCFLRLSVHCPMEEFPIFSDFVEGISSRHALSVEAEPGFRVMADGIPDAVLKTTPCRVPSLTRRLREHGADRCVGLCGCGVVQVYLPGSSLSPEGLHPLLEPCFSELHETGGDWRSRHVPRPPHGEMEQAWLARLKKEWRL